MFALIIALSWLLAAADVSSGTGSALPGAAQAAAVPARSGSSPSTPQQSGPPSFADLSDADLLTKAEAAKSDRHAFAPAGDNAIEYYLALRDRHPDDDSVKRELTDLFTYAAIGAELVAGSRDKAGHAEAVRILALLDRIDPIAPALPRLRARIEGRRGR